MTTLTTPLGDFGPPPDAAAWAALVVAAALLAYRAFERGSRREPSRPSGIAALSDRVVVGGLALLAFSLSAEYVALYLRGGPRIIDATSYFLQARALARGYVTFPVPAPSASFRGRFLVAGPAGDTLAVIFPPGYPALLALGFVAGAPMLVGPVLAALLVIATYAVSFRIFEDRKVARLAAALSAVCAVLRYHTADTMSHGVAALCLAATTWGALGAGVGSAAVAGASAGWLFATRPVSGCAAFALIAVSWLRARPPPRVVAVALCAAVVPVTLFIVEQWLASGRPFTSTQSLYYSLADSPPGCFRYGFGDNIGCRFEHGDFVDAHLRDGYGVVAAAGTTLRRLKMHLADAGNTELFAPLLLYALVRAAREPRVRLAALGVALVIAAYVPFYFDGNYPGGGARFYADALPLEHVLLAWVLVRAKLSDFAIPLALAGFALHTSYDHRRLAEREGGRPMFEPGVLAAAGIENGLVFVDTDHGFNLGHSPVVAGARDEIVVARARGDARDFLLWERLGRPPAYRYSFAAGARFAVPRITTLSLTRPRDFRFEAEAEWPALAVESGSVMPAFVPCASGGRGLSLHPVAGRILHARVALDVPAPGTYQIRTRWAFVRDGDVTADVEVAGHRWSIHQRGSSGTCFNDAGPRLNLHNSMEFMDIYAESPATLDLAELAH